MRQKTSVIHRPKIFNATTHRWGILGLALAALAGTALAQEAPFNSTDVSRFDQSGQSYADVWGDGNFAYIGHFGQEVVDIIDITDPENPILAATYDSNVSSASAQDVKVAEGLMFVGLEGASPGAQIVDVRDPYAPVKLTDITVLPGVHNSFYDQGWLYLVDSAQTIIEIIDLRSYDPDDPPAVISESTWQMTGVGGQIVHDITVQNGRLYVSAWDTMRVYDVTNVANESPPLLGTAAGDNVHAAWATDDGRFLVVTEERSISGLTLYEVFDNGTSVELVNRDYYFISSLRALSVHNVVIEDYRVYVSWYAAGVQVFEIDPETATFTLIASFDTTPSDGDDSPFAGNWGVYPFLGTDRILASDRGTGLWVLDVKPNVLRFKYPNGLPRIVAPDVKTSIEVNISPVGAPPEPATVMRRAAIDGGAPLDQILADEGSGIFSGTLPPASCGNVIQFSLSAENTLGTPFVDPPGAPAESYRVDIATETDSVFEDNFDLDMGWTVSNTNLENGEWVRGDSRGTGGQPENDATGAGDGSSFFTAQGPVGGSISEADVDGGPTTLTSPPMDLSGGGGLISYAYWHFNDDGTDALIVEVSADGAAWVEVRRYEGTLGGWREDTFHTADFVASSDETQVRFVIADNPNDSVTEAAIDNFSATRLICTIPIFLDSFESGDTSAWSSTIP